MREHALTPHRVRAWLATTNSDHKQPIYPNLRSSITPEGPDELWVADLTYIRLTTGFVFLAVVLDAWSRRVIGYAISHLLDTRLCLAALDAALDLRQPRAGLVHHSDRGVQYASRAYRSRLAAHGIRGSMSRRGNPYDNAHVESFFTAATSVPRPCSRPIRASKSGVTFLGDEVMAAALIDRLLHHCHIVNIRGNSYRMRHHTKLSKVLHSPPAESSSSPPRKRRRTSKETTTT